MNPLRVVLPQDRREPAAPRQGDYVPPPHDRTIIKARITRPCWTRTREGGDIERVEAGAVVTMERWIADELRLCGKAETL